jgi:two-component system chemotaxis sensor kinase CheA
MSRDELLETFFQECEDLLEVVESGLSELDSGSKDEETINSIFRAVHSIKGGAGAFALDDLVDFAHKFETKMDDVRSDKLELDRPLISVFLRCSDMLADLIVAANAGGEVDYNAVQELCDELGVGESSEEDELPEFTPQAMSLDLSLAPVHLTPHKRDIRIAFHPNSEFYSRGNETTLLLRALCELGECEITCNTSNLPEFGTLEPEDGYLSWEILLRTKSDIAEVSEIFEFSETDCDLEVEELGQADRLDDPDEPSQHQGLSKEGSETSDREQRPRLTLIPIGDENVEAFERNFEDVPSKGQMLQKPDDTTSSADAENEPAPIVAVPQASDVPKREVPTSPKGNDGQVATIRVGLDRIERLVNLVGELVVNQAMLAQSMSTTAMLSSDVNDGLDEFRRLTRDIQESVMAIRAQPVKPLFQRMSRIVREAAQATGKDVRLVMEGSETEIDKTVLERLADPLTHMIRNAVDHGLETPDVRNAAGKDNQGIVTLIAAHRSGRVVIEIRDDGAGINRQRVRQIAEEKELISTDDILTDTEVDNLLFLPGFSTAKEVSNLSGRGVGMDVVRKSIQSLGGRITIASEPGQGTSLAISLPLTLAVVDGIVVEVAGETLIVPMTSVVETQKVSADDAYPIDSHSWTLRSRGDVVPLIDVGYELGIREERSSPIDKVAIVAGTEDGAQSAIVVDRVEDQRQVVIKSLETNYGEVQGIAAATILGDGRIALILDVERLIEAASGPSTAGNRSRKVAEAL